MRDFGLFFLRMMIRKAMRLRKWIPIRIFVILMALSLLAFTAQAFPQSPDKSILCDPIAVAQARADAEHNIAAAQLRLSQMYFSGQCVAKDINEGSKWLTQASQNGDATAQAVLASVYYDAENMVQSAKWARLSADQGDAKGESLLALLYSHGKGVPQDDREAVKWARQSAEQGAGPGEAILAGLYYDGRGGLQKDNVEALKWYILANSTDFSNSWLTITQTMLETRMSKQDITEAHKRANAWKQTWNIKQP